jgi:hypothetical protein
MALKESAHITKTPIQNMRKDSAGRGLPKVMPVSTARPQMRRLSIFCPVGNQKSSIQHDDVTSLARVPDASLQVLNNVSEVTMMRSTLATRQQFGLTWDSTSNRSDDGSVVLATTLPSRAAEHSTQFPMADTPHRPPMICPCRAVMNCEGKGPRHDHQTLPGL